LKKSVSDNPYVYNNSKSLIRASLNLPNSANRIISPTFALPEIPIADVTFLIETCPYPEAV